MPIMTGLDASKKILQMTKDANQEDYCHIVALTSYTSLEIKDTALAIGIKEVINKPIHCTELKRMVHLHFYRTSEEQLIEQFPDL